MMCTQTVDQPTELNQTGRPATIHTYDTTTHTHMRTKITCTGQAAASPSAQMVWPSICRVISSSIGTSRLSACCLRLIEVGCAASQSIDRSASMSLVDGRAARQSQQKQKEVTPHGRRPFLPCPYLADLHALEDGLQPARPLPAGRALPARLVPGVSVGGDGG